MAISGRPSLVLITFIPLTPSPLVPPPPLSFSLFSIYSPLWLTLTSLQPPGWGSFHCFFSHITCVAFVLLPSQTSSFG